LIALLLIITSVNSIPINIAHRGFSQLFPENTLGGLSAACFAGADYVEVDV